MLRLPSAQRTYDDYFTGDLAFAQPSPDAKPDDVAAWRRAWETARKTGNFAGLLAEPSASATRFGMRLIPSDPLRKLQDMLVRNSIKTSAEVAIRSEEWQGLVFRCAIVDISGFDDAKVRLLPKLVHVAGHGELDLGVIASSDILTALDAVTPAIVAELALEAWVRSTTRDPR